MLDAPLGQQQRLGACERASALVYGGGHDQVDGPPLVLEQQEHRPFRRPRTLASYHHSGNRDRAAVGQARQLRAGRERFDATWNRQAWTQSRHHVIVRGHTAGGVVGEQRLPAVELTETGRRGWLYRQRELNRRLAERLSRGGDTQLP